MVACIAFLWSPRCPTQHPTSTSDPPPLSQPDTWEHCTGAEHYSAAVPGFNSTPQPLWKRWQRAVDVLQHRKCRRVRVISFIVHCQGTK